MPNLKIQGEAFLNVYNDTEAYLSIIDEDLTGKYVESDYPAILETYLQENIIPRLNDIIQPAGYYIYKVDYPHNSTLPSIVITRLKESLSDKKSLSSNDLGNIKATISKAISILNQQKLTQTSISAPTSRYFGKPPTNTSSTTKKQQHRAH